MAINGIEILNQTINYDAHWSLGIFILIFTILVGIGCFRIEENIKGGNLILLLGITGLLFIIIFAPMNCDTFFTYPKSIDYTIEIFDDNAWKEIGPNYNVKKKLYDNHEIYLIEGDYIND